VPSSSQNERMEVKNSGIPGPGAISWKRKSCEESAPVGNSSKKRKVVENCHNDPYSFEEEDRTAKPGQARPEVKEEPSNGTVSSGGYKYKSALLSRETAGGNDSDESGSSSPTKKKKRPKLEEWSVNKEKKGKNGLASSAKTEILDNTELPSRQEKNIKKGSLWGLPIVPKPPVKTSDKPVEVKKVKEEKTSEKNSGKVSVTDVWLQAFGAGGSNKSKKKESETASTNSVIAKKPVKPEPVESTTILDIPPEVRRKPRPKFGGLIHFDSDWSRAVRRHHERCRVPGSLENSSQLAPKILAGQQTPKKCYEDLARKAMVSPPNMLAIEKERLERTAIAPKIEPVINEDELTGQLPSIVESILENRKKMRETDVGRIYKIPFMKEKKKRMRGPVQSEVKVSNLGLLPTPGLPLLTEDTKDVLMGSGFGNFRHYTLIKYLENESSEEDIVEPKSRRQSGVSKSKVSLKEIFGVLESPGKKSKVKTEEKSKVKTEEKSKVKTEEKSKVKTEEKSKIKSEENTVTVTPVKREKKKKSKPESQKTASIPNSVPRIFSPKIQAPAEGEVEPEDCGYSHEVGEPTQDEKNLQFELGAFALDLLEENPSWIKQTTIQNLVIWEPAEPQVPELAKRKKGKKKKTRKSGLDFTSSRRRTKSAVASRAGSPSSGDVHEILYSLDNVVTESQRWVIDKNAGETILHRASKMGYPDVVAYALDKLSMSPMERDYAGLTPLHKSALKGHDLVTKILLSYGADPSAGVKGTRALHEAIEGGNPGTAQVLLSYGADPLLHDYSGNMPLDLATERTMQLYFTNILADLHGKVPTRAKSESTYSTSVLSRWNVSHSPDFHLPPDSLFVKQQHSKGRQKKEEEIITFEAFDAPAAMVPSFFQLKDKEGEWLLYKDLKDFSRKHCNSKHDIKSKGTLLEMKKTEFLRSSHCKQLARAGIEVCYDKKDDEDGVTLVKVDKFVRKILSMEVTEMPLA